MFHHNILQIGTLYYYIIRNIFLLQVIHPLIWSQESITTGERVLKRSSKTSLLVGFEPDLIWLHVRCSTNCATGAMPLEAITWVLVSSYASDEVSDEQLHTTSDVKPPPHSSPTTVGTWMTSVKGQQSSWYLDLDWNVGCTSHYAFKFK